MDLSQSKDEQRIPERQTDWLSVANVVGAQGALSEQLEVKLANRHFGELDQNWLNAQDSTTLIINIIGQQHNNNTRGGDRNSNWTPGPGQSEQTKQEGLIQESNQNTSSSQKSAAVWAGKSARYVGCKLVRGLFILISFLDWRGPIEWVWSGGGEYKSTLPMEANLSQAENAREING